MAAVGRVGIEYNYHFWLDYGMLQHGYRLTGERNFIFEVRTNFFLKKKKIIDDCEDEDEDEDGYEDEILDSETLGLCFSYKDNNYILPLLFFICYRLDDYWMTVEEADALESDAIGFARRQMAAAHPQLSNVVIPVVVGINVCTVQQEGETIDAARDRAIRAKHLVPVYLWQVPSFKLDHFNRPGPPKVMSFLRLLPRIRVVNDDDGDFVCSICSKKPWFGVQKTSLPSCGHTFHSHCVVPWLEHNHLCPSCGSPAYDPDIRHFFFDK